MSNILFAGKNILRLIWILSHCLGRFNFRMGESRCQYLSGYLAFMCRCNSITFTFTFSLKRKRGGIYLDWCHKFTIGDITGLQAAAAAGFLVGPITD